MTLKPAQAKKLALIVAATASEVGLAYYTEKSVQVLVDADYAECNIGMTNPGNDKEVAVRATPTGIAYVEQANAPATESEEPMNHDAQAPVAESKFPIMSGRTIPAIRRNGASKSQYPFDGLEVGQSFFVPASEEMPNPAKTLASTVSSAAKRYATENGTRTINRKVDGVMAEVEVAAYTYTRKFMVRSSELNGIAGAEVFRVAVEAVAE